MAVPPLQQIRTNVFVRHAIPQARKIVLDIFRKMGPEDSLTTQELYAQCRAVDVKLPDRFIPLEVDGMKGRPEFPEHPIRSKGYLKNTVLKDLVSRSLLQKVMYRRLRVDGEIPDYLTHAARVERRNNHRFKAGKPARGTVSVAKEVWVWQVTDNGHKLLSSDKPDAHFKTGEVEQAKDHLNDDQIQDISRINEGHHILTPETDTNLFRLTAKRQLRMEMAAQTHAAWQSSTRPQHTFGLSTTPNPRNSSAQHSPTPSSRFHVEYRGPRPFGIHVTHSNDAGERQVQKGAVTAALSDTEPHRTTWEHLSDSSSTSTQSQKNFSAGWTNVNGTLRPSQPWRRPPT
ncbi:hypothetical protein BKA62DRAFT_681894 [Auriculariales sp. MPI-PUGE-AT-0066]|nr:hypothetical protein BKA62DRAFT_681894 [Auriculariales sp. MPI-PUGE-AT-0066]